MPVMRVADNRYDRIVREGREQKNGHDRGEEDWTLGVGRAIARSEEPAPDAGARDAGAPVAGTRSSLPVPAHTKPR
jgi:hypothetical protein